MIPLSAIPSALLTWSRIPHSHSYELRSADGILASLQHLRGMSPHFIAHSQEGRWIFRRNGFLGAGADIVDADSQQQIATFKAAWSGGGVLSFSDGEKFQLECEGLWHPVWTFTHRGQPVLRLHSREKTVDLLGSDLAEHRLSVLILFTWYRVLQAQEDAAAAAMIAS